MSLKMKLYAGFGIMIVVALVVNLLSIRFFSVANGHVDATGAAIDLTATECTPINVEAFSLATQILEAGNGAYIYSINQLEETYDQTREGVKQMAETVRNIDAILASIPPDHLPVTRKTLPALKAKMAEFDAGSQAMHDAINRLLEVRRTMGEDAAKLDATLAAAHANILRDLSAPGSGKSSPEDARSLAARLEFVNGLTKNLGNALANFWHAQAVHDLDEARAADQAAEKMLRENIDNIAKYRNSGAAESGEAARIFQAIQTDFEQFIASLEQCRGRNEEILAHAANTVDSYHEINGMVVEITGAATELLTGNVGVVQEGMEGIAGAVKSSSGIMMAGAAIALNAGMLIAFLLVRSVTLPINRIIDSLTHGAEAVRAASSQIASASNSLARGATAQAASLEETSSALEQMASMTRQNADNADRTRKITAHAGKVVEDGAAAMVNMTEAMADINERSEKVSNIVKTIEDITFQTNLLALNAAVEAARAGEAGKGFAVVADEVRNLSQRSAQAAKDTTELIAGSVASVHRGTGIAASLTANFAEIHTGMDEVVTLVGGIAAATQEQASGVDQVNTAVAQMDKVTQQNAAQSEETASASGHLDAEANSLANEVDNLLALVYGTSAAARGTGSSGRGGGGRSPQRLLPLKTAAHPVAGGKDPGFSRNAAVREVAASEIVPLDEDPDGF
ncbi:MAG: methyl-accepting chemotaxis protein [Planctomycetota bacterium]|jgi:methyl-accepting chemotaxis protein|nr:methyl-accepting chemotaxis protein [Planctomycetota bacterium]